MLSCDREFSAALNVCSGHMSGDRHVASKAVGEWNKSLCNDRKLRIANELLQTAESRQIDVWGAASADRQGHLY